MYKEKIRHLKEMQRVLDKKIEDHKKSQSDSSKNQVLEWEKQNLQIRDEIRRLEKLQWEHDYETVDFDDR